MNSFALELDVVVGLDPHASLGSPAGLALMPGPYRFYYVSESGIIVNAEPLEPDAAYLGQHCVALAGLFGNDDADLAANRRGELSAQQQATRAATDAAATRQLLKQALACLAIGVPLVAVRFALLRAAAASPWANALLLPACLGGIFLSLWVISISFTGAARVLRTARQRTGGGGGHAQAIDGQVVRYPSEDTGHPFQLAIAGQVLGLRTEPVPVAYGLRYRAYHCDGELIGLELLEGPCRRPLATGSGGLSSENVQAAGLSSS